MHFPPPPTFGPIAVFSAACLQILADSDTQRSKSDALYWAVRQAPPNSASLRAGSAELVQLSAVTLANAQRLLELADELDGSASNSSQHAPANASAVLSRA